MKIITIVFAILLTIISCQNHSIPIEDKTKAIELNDKALDLRLHGDINQAEELYTQAFKLDSTNLTIHSSLLSIYEEKKEIQKAFDLLEKLPLEEKNTSYYYLLKGRIFNLDSNMQKANENYIKSYELGEMIEIKDELDLNELTSYALIETFAGYKSKAVTRMNEALKLDWLSESNIEHLEHFRNEFEYYQGNGFLEFESNNEITISTNNLDSLLSILEMHHINTSHISYPIDEGNQSRVYINEKFRTGLENLGIDLNE